MAEITSKELFKLGQSVAKRNTKLTLKVTGQVFRVVPFESKDSVSGLKKTRYNYTVIDMKNQQIYEFVGSRLFQAGATAEFLITLSGFTAYESL